MGIAAPFSICGRHSIKPDLKHPVMLSYNTLDQGFMTKLVCLMHILLSCDTAEDGQLLKPSQVLWSVGVSPLGLHCVGNYSASKEVV